MFDHEGYLNRVLTKVMYIVAVNILFLVSRLPVFTIGASGSAMYTVLFRYIQGDEPDIIKTFFGEFKSVFKKATLIWLGMLAVTVLDSLKTKGDLVSNFVGLPREISFSGYASVLVKGDFLLYVKNSLVLTVFGTAGCILLSAMAAYGIARYQFKGKGLLSSYFMVGMMVPVQVSILPITKPVIFTMALIRSLYCILRSLPRSWRD